MALLANVRIYWGRGQTITAYGGTINPVEQSRRRVVRGTGWQKVTPDGALKSFLERIKIEKLFVPYEKWTTLEIDIIRNRGFTDKINSLPQIRILRREEIENLLQEALKGTGFDAALFIGFGEAYFYPSDLRKAGGAAAPKGRAMRSRHFK